jgi:hypothetical protein
VLALSPLLVQVSSWRPALKPLAGAAAAAAAAAVLAVLPWRSLEAKQLLASVERKVMIADG